MVVHSNPTRWYICTSPDFVGFLGILAASPEEAAKEALSSWIIEAEIEEDDDYFYCNWAWDDENGYETVVTVLPTTPQGTQDGEPTTWQVTARRRITFETKAVPHGGPTAPNPGT